MTKKEMFEKVIALVESAEVENKDEILEKLNHEVDMLNSRKSSSKPTAVQKANDVLMKLVKEILAEQENPVSVTELMQDPRLATYTIEKEDGPSVQYMTNQKLTSILGKLCDVKEVVKTVEKKKSYFSIA